MSHHQLARPLSVVPPNGLDELFVRFLRGPHRARVPHLSQRRYQQLAVRGHSRIEDFVVGGPGELDVKIHARLGVGDAVAYHRATLLNVLGEARNGCRIGALRRERGRRRLDHGARLGELRERHALEPDHRRERLRDAIGVRVGDECPARRSDLHADETARLEDPQRVADRDA